MPNASTVDVSWLDFTEPERHRIVRRVLDGEDIDELAEELGMRPRTLQRRVQDFLTRLPTSESKIERGNFKRHWKLYCKFIGHPGHSPRRVAKKKTGRRRKVAVLCDLHGNPHPKVLKDVLAHEPDIIVLDGDVFNAHAFSHWPKMAVSPITEEIARIRAMLEVITSQGIEVVIVTGNHDERARTFFAARVPTEYLPLIQWNLLELAAADLPHVTLVDNSYEITTSEGTGAGSVSNNYVYFLGDAALTHVNVARKADGATASKVLSWLDDNRRALGWPEARLVVQAHCHRANVSYPRGGHLTLVEGGFSGWMGSCQAGREGSLQYQHDLGSGAYGPAVLGFTYLEQIKTGDTWRTDLPSVRFVLC